MPFKPVEAAKCPRCSKTVYAQEERLAGESMEQGSVYPGGKKWHTSCFLCSTCNKVRKGERRRGGREEERRRRRGYENSGWKMSSW